MKTLFVWLLCFCALFASADTEVNLYVSRNIAPAQKIRLNINTKNVPSINLEIRRIDPIAWLARPSLQDKRPAVTGAPLRVFPITVIQPKQRPNLPPADTYYGRQVNLPPMSPGVYLLNSQGPHKGQNWAVVVVTNLAVIAKRSPSRLLAWVTDFRTGKVVPGIDASLYARTGDRVAGGKTNGDGVCLIERKSADETLIVRQGNDFAGVPASVEDPDGRLVAHFQTDRPIYRPGQKVSFKVAMRYTNGQGYSVKPGQKVRIWVKDSKDTAIDLFDLTASKVGTVTGESVIPAEGSMGPYTLVLEAGKQSAYQTFTVAAYRKPEYKVEVKPTAVRALAGETVRFTLAANYYFGAPVPQAQVQYVVRRSNLYYGYQQDEGGYYSGDGNLYPRDTYAGDDAVANETVYTDNLGNVTVEVKTDPKAPDSTYQIEATVTDGSRRQVSGSSAIPVYAANIRMGLSSELLCVPLGKLIPVTIRVTDLDGKPASASPVLKLIDTVWREKLKKYEDVVLASIKASVPASGKLTVDVPAKAVGSLRIEATAGDGTGRSTSASMWTYIIGPFEKAVKEIEQPQVQVRLDRRSYTIGDVVSAFVMTNRVAGTRAAKTGPMNTPILAVIEGRDVFDYKVHSTAQRSHKLEFRAALTNAPNAFVDAVQWVDGQMVSASVVVPIPDPSRRMSVSVTPDKQEYRPGDQATYMVRTLDAKGQPIAAEVALSVVDEAIYALQSDSTADAYQLYWGRRGNQVITTGSAPEELSGGAYQRVSTVAPVRQRFEDTAFWSGVVMTDSHGEAKVTFEMPGNLTSWRATARAIDGDTRVGMAKGTVLATRPVTLRLAMPRLMAQGDELKIIATVNNRSAERREFDVSLKGGASQKQRVVVEPKSEGRIEFTIDAPTLGTREVTAEAVDVATGSADYSDALKVGVSVVPNAVAERAVVARRVDGNGKVAIALPADIVPQAGSVTVRVYAGAGARIQDFAAQILRTPRYGTPVAVAHLYAATITTDLAERRKSVREAVALLSRLDTGTGWGWWEGAKSDAYVSAAVLRALVTAKSAKLDIPDRLMDSAKNAVRYLYERTNLWEHRAILASALLVSGAEKGSPYVDEVLERGQNLSPYARLRLAQVLKGGRRETVLNDVSKDISKGPAESYLPVGDGIGWQATEAETNALLLQLTKGEEALGLSEWLQNRMGSGWAMEDAECLLALTSYLDQFPERTSTGPVAISLNGTEGAVIAGRVADVKSATFSSQNFHAGENQIEVRASGAVRVLVEANVYRPVSGENDRGIRVLRRFEIRNAAGTWVEATGTLPAGLPVRVTSVVWGDSVPDAIRVIEPLPAGFEYVEDDHEMAPGRQEVRDGAVVHYVQAGGTPLVFRYFMRAESTGKVTIIPAIAEVLRRPTRRGNTGSNGVIISSVKN